MLEWTRRAPVALIVFNRPDTTARVFAEVARARPAKLFVIADGPRAERSDEAGRCRAVRNIVQRVDWPCELITNFSEQNLGCKRRLSSGLDWLFSQTEEAIILEDDCVPHPAFFRFADELLERYRHEPRVAQICGVNFRERRDIPADSYYFSRYPHIWGWASWRRAWRHYDVEMRSWPELRETRWLPRALGDSRQAAYWQRRFDRVHAGQIDTWDYQWTFACWKNDLVSIIPQSNLISNVGFGRDATHTRRKGSPLADLPAAGVEFPLRHPPSITRDPQQDDLTDAMFFSGTRTLSGLARRVLEQLRGFV